MAAILSKGRCVDTITADSLAPCLTRSSVAMLLLLQDEGLLPRVLALFHVSVFPAQRRYSSKSLRISAIGQTFGGMMHSTVKQIAM